MPFATRLLTTPHQDNGLSSDGSDTGSPVLSLLNQLDTARYPYLLSSSAQRQNNTQFDILFACPDYHVTLRSDRTLHCSDTDIELAATFFESLDTLYQHDREISESQSDIPFTGGWFVYLSYEMAEEIEPCLKLPVLESEQPLAVASRVPAAIIYDRQNNSFIAVAESGYEYLLDQIEQDYLKVCTSDENVAHIKSSERIKLVSLIENDEQPYLKQVEKIKQYIVDGDIFQANLSRLWQGKLEQQVADARLFSTLAHHNPSSFAALVCLQDMTIISSSPERLVSLRDGIVETRPIAGTRPRDSDQQSDDALAKELLAHPKEQAEHIMLIDLERNDLGRVCRPGSIEVNELMVLESWQHVHHIVSNVRGEVAEDKSPVDVIRAVFPGGTITGCPKVHCIEILAEMEQQPRGAYTGSLGYINNDGSMDFNILIRTMVRENDKITFRAGGGIVSDSIAEKELDETRAKAKGLLKMFDYES